MFSRYTYICMKQTFQKLLIFIAPIEHKLPTVAISGKVAIPAVASESNS